MNTASTSNAGFSRDDGGEEEELLMMDAAIENEQDFSCVVCGAPDSDWDENAEELRCHDHKDLLLRGGHRVFVGRVDCTTEPERFATVREGEARIVEIALEDPEGVERGDYYVDAPEGWVERERERQAEREALRREERQEAMLDAGGILAEYRQAKGE